MVWRPSVCVHSILSCDYNNTRTLKVTFSQKRVVLQKRQNKTAHLKLLNGLFLAFKDYIASIPPPKSDFQTWKSQKPFLKSPKMGHLRIFIMRFLFCNVWRMTTFWEKLAFNGVICMLVSNLHFGIFLQKCLRHRH